MSIRGIDVSKWQGEINWNALRGHVDFVVMKATQGTTEVDGQFHRNRKAARELRIPHAFYHYINCENPIAEADHFLDVCGREPGEGQSLDFEGSILTTSDPAGWALAWLNRVHERTHNRPFPYMSGSTTTRFDWRDVVREGYGLWDADWSADAPNPGAWPMWAMWQTSDTGHVAGIDGEVDTDVFNGDLDALMRYFANDGDAPKPNPSPPAATHPRAPEGVTAHPVPGSYVVRRGDTLSGIASRYGVTWVDLAKLNYLHAPYVIFPNEVLRVSGARPAVTPHSSDVYTVRRGDTFGSIASKHNMTLTQLEDKNRQIHNPSLIFPGERVNL